MCNTVVLPGYPVLVCVPYYKPGSTPCTSVQPPSKPSAAPSSSSPVFFFLRGTISVFRGTLKYSIARYGYPQPAARLQIKKGGGVRPYAVELKKTPREVATVYEV